MSAAPCARHHRFYCSDPHCAPPRVRWNRDTVAAWALVVAMIAIMVVGHGLRLDR